MASKIKVDQIQTADGTGTIALQNQLSGMTGVSMPTGSVLQVVNATYSTEIDFTTTSYVDTGLTATITPSSSSSKILILVSQCGIRKPAANSYLTLRLMRGSTLVTQISITSGYNNSSTIASTSESTCSLDSPNTTSAVIYKTEGNRSGASGTINMNVNDVTSTMTLMEIAG